MEMCRGDNVIRGKLRLRLRLRLPVLRSEHSNALLL